MIDEETQPDAVNLNSMTKAQLIDYADQLGIDGVSSRMTKAQIIEVVQE